MTDTPTPAPFDAEKVARGLLMVHATRQGRRPVQDYDALATRIAVALQSTHDNALKAGAEGMRERAARAADDGCHCDRAYIERGLTDPNCAAHDIANDIMALPLTPEPKPTEGTDDEQSPG